MHAPFWTCWYKLRGFPTIMDPFLGVLVRRIIVYWGLFWGAPYGSPIWKPQELCLKSPDTEMFDACYADFKEAEMPLLGPHKYKHKSPKPPKTVRASRWTPNVRKIIVQNLQNGQIFNEGQCCFVGCAAPPRPDTQLSRTFFTPITILK